MVKYTDQVSLEVHLYKYDALGRRIGKVVDSTGLTGGPTETRFYYGGKGFQQVIEEQDELGATQATYVYGMYIDDTVQMRRGGQDYYYHCDDLYNTMAITDSAGVVVERYEYGDYGQVEFRDASGTALATQASAIGNPYLFTGRRFDEETGLYWYRTRYYDSNAGRFASRDSIGIWGDPLELGNGLAYVGNNPWTHTDPLGLGFWSDVGDAIDIGLEWAEGGLDIAGMLPGGGIVADLGSVGINILQGDGEGALLSGIAAIPIIGQGAGAAKIAKRLKRANKASDALKIFKKIDLPGKGKKNWRKLKGNQGWKDKAGNIWKKDKKHKDHWDVSDRKGKKIKEVDYDGREIWPDGPKNKNKKRRGGTLCGD